MVEVVVIGASAGGMQALKSVLSGLPADFPLPVVIVQHIEAGGDSYLVEYLARACALAVKEAEDKETLCAATAYVAPPGYHLLVEADRSFSLSVDDKVNYCRPAIDLLFESAADAFGGRLIGVVLTGANADGAKGLKQIRACGGVAVVQDPVSAHSPAMPKAAIAAGPVDHVAKLEQIAPLLVKLSKEKGVRHGTAA